MQLDKQNIAAIANRIQNIVDYGDPEAVRYFVKGTSKKGLGLHNPDYYEDIKKVKSVIRKLNMIKKINN